MAVYLGSDGHSVVKVHDGTNYHLPSSYRYKLDKTIALQYHKCNRYNHII